GDIELLDRFNEPQVGAEAGRSAEHQTYNQYHLFHGTPHWTDSIFSRVKKHKNTRAGSSLYLTVVIFLYLCPLPVSAQDPAAVFNQYCVTCHNARLKTGGVIIDPADVAHLATKPELWEKVIRKLRSESMPPAGSPRPSAATYDSVATFLESELDRANAAKPNPGTLPLFHRLTRTEYQNAVRDLLDRDARPRDMSIPLFLPADNVTSGFDNIADLLFVSPATMERYLDAARKISRLAVGDPEMPVMVNIHRLHPEQ